ncbi:ArsR family transcriptional regulator [Natronomonas gomsonensis]|uniref:ArsR family transcriptional regulator n=1 Tax=Natronomonas gomsonensis TaxID=1046043 RepID=UPI0015BDF905|nr:ArsR family transcriptional regulator [Natronomonas gomsonensis]
MSSEWDEIGYVISSKYRVAVLRQLASEPSTPTTIAEESGLGITHISRALRRLREREMVELLVPEARQKGRLYALTELGEAVWKRILTADLLT